MSGCDTVTCTNVNCGCKNAYPPGVSISFPVGHLQELILIPRNVRTRVGVVTTWPFAAARLEINPGRLPSVLRIMVTPRGNYRFLKMLSGLSDLGLHGCDTNGREGSFCGKEPRNLNPSMKKFSSPVVD